MFRICRPSTTSQKSGNSSSGTAASEDISWAANPEKTLVLMSGAVPVAMAVSRTSSELAPAGMTSHSI
jgi:hypothetical protein